MHLECLLGAGLEQCPTCQQPYHGECELGLARQQWARVRDDRPEDDEERLAGAERLARALNTALGDYAAALPLLEDVLAARRRTLGAEAEATLQSLHDCAQQHLDLQSFAAGLPLAEEALRLRRQTLGYSHPRALDSLALLSQLHAESGDLEAALPLAQEALTGRRQRLGQGHMDTVISMADLCTLHYRLGDRTAAAPLFREGVEKGLKIFRTTTGSRASKSRPRAENLLGKDGKVDAEVAALGAALGAVGDPARRRRRGALPNVHLA